MNINVWGPGLWELIHTVAFNYNKSKIPENVKKVKYINLFTSLGNLIPCNKCKLHYISFLKKNPIQNYASSYSGIIKWTNNLHNNVNIKLKKKVFSLQSSKNKFMPGNKLNISHQKIYNFINNSVNLVNSSNKESFKIFMNSILYLFPCETCRKKIVYVNKLLREKKLVLGEIKNLLQLKIWYSKIKVHLRHK